MASIESLPLIREAHKQIRAFVNERIRENGLDELAFPLGPILFRIYQFPETTSLELQESLCLSKSRISESLSALRERGYIEYESCQEDRREKRIVLTQKGKAHQEKVFEVIRAAEEDIARGIPEKDLISLSHTLSLIIENCGGEKE